MTTIFRDKVTIGTQTFNDPLAKPAGAIEWGLDVLDPWSGTPELDAKFAPLGSIDGEIAADFFSARGKQLAVGGYVVAVDRATAESLWDVIVRDAFPRNQELVLTRYESVPKFARVRVNGPREIAWTGPTAFRWGVPVRAADPFKYSLVPAEDSAITANVPTNARTYPRVYPLVYTFQTTTAFVNGMSLVNLGTADSDRIMVTMNGPYEFGGWRLVNGDFDNFLKLDIGLSSTDQLVIDFHNEAVYLNGYLVTQPIIGDFWKFKPGVNVIRLYVWTDAGLSSFSVTAYSAWE